jgi:ABC-type sugar transport system ATPase subunit
VLTARLDPHEKLKSGQALDIVFDMSRCHFFDPQSGRNLSV